MTKWRVYKHFFQFEHRVDDREELVDKACCDKHQHGFMPNKKCEMHVGVSTPNYWLDYKVIKEVVNTAMDNICISRHARDLPGFWHEERDTPYYDFGTIDTETLVEEIKKQVTQIILEKTKDPSLKVFIWMDETNKYSYWDDGK